MNTMQGLSEAEAAARLRKFGRNELAHAPPPGPVAIFARQFASVLVLLLAIAAGVALLLGERADAIAIAAILLLNAVVGFLQEYRAERALVAMRAMTAPRARVRRDGRERWIAAAEVVPGDLLILEAGDIVAADAHLLAAAELEVDEALLTGESTPVRKSVEPVPVSAPIGDRSDYVWAGTTVRVGRGEAEVVATGNATELGKIAGLLSTTERETTPLERQLAHVGRTLATWALLVVAIVAALGLMRGEPWTEVLLLAIALAVAAVPEGLPAMVTIALALGVQRMAARNVWVRRLPAIEALGSVTVIATDKTGTLTTGRMAVREVWAAPGSDDRAVLDAAAACCDASLQADAPGGGVGDPSEIAILMAARALGIERDAIEAARPRVRVIPFTSERKRMAIVRGDGRIYVKGAVEAIAAVAGGDHHAAFAAASAFAARGLRVLAVAVGQGQNEADAHLIGLIALADPPRPEAAPAVAAARAAGIRTLMVTGDHPITACAIAREIGILEPDQDPQGIVYARVSPQTKLELVHQLKAAGEIVAMTGDGVNDAPALAAAHVGVAMGLGGTEVAREAADIVLADDNYASIVAGIAEGRTIFANLQRALVYLLVGNVAELLLMLASTLVGLPAPLTALHILWINLVTDGLPALALAMEPSDSDALRRRPRDPQRAMLGRAEAWLIARIAILEASVVLGLYVVALRLSDAVVARTLAFTALVVSEVLRAVAARDMHVPIWRVNRRNRLLALVIPATLCLQAALVLLPWSQAWFDLGKVSLSALAFAFAVGAIPLAILEVFKSIAFYRRQRMTDSSTLYTT